MIGLPAYGSQLGNVFARDGNAYVANMTEHRFVDFNGATTVLWENPVADNTVLLAATAVVGGVDLDIDLEIDETFGRNLNVVSSDAGQLTIHGFDFLGQVMSRNVTCTTNAAGVNAVKAFKWISRLSPAANLTGNITLRAGAGYGLPFCGVEVIREVSNSDSVAADGALTTPDSSVATADTNDVRGTFNPGTVTNGERDIQLTYRTTSRRSGGLYGRPQA